MVHSHDQGFVDYSKRARQPPKNYSFELKSYTGTKVGVPQIFGLHKTLTSVFLFQEFCRIATHAVPCSNTDTCTWRVPKISSFKAYLTPNWPTFGSYLSVFFVVRILSFSCVFFPFFDKKIKIKIKTAWTPTCQNIRSSQKPHVMAYVIQNLFFMSLFILKYPLFFSFFFSKSWPT